MSIAASALMAPKRFISMAMIKASMTVLFLFVETNVSQVAK